MAEKKVDLREMAYERVASSILQADSNLRGIRRHKEGLELRINDEVFAVRVVKKKEELDKSQFRGEFFKDERDESVGYNDYKSK